MTGKVVSLSRARKTREREDKRRQADANAAKHGRTKADKVADAAEANKAERDLDGHRRDDD